jgi:large-conductance mechanosensitive channel
MSSLLKQLNANAYNDFQQFVFSNNLLASAAGFSIGMATKEFLANILNELVLPIIMYVFAILWYILKTYTNVLPEGIGKNPIFLGFYHSLSSIVWTTTSWFLTIVLTFVVLEYIINRQIFGLVSTVEGDKKKDFIISKIEAKKSNTTSLEQKTKIIEEEEHKQEKIAMMPMDQGKEKEKMIKSIVEKYSHYPSTYS